MRKYFAWVFFVMGTVNLINLAVMYATKSDRLPPMIFEVLVNPSLSNLSGALSSFFVLFSLGLMFYIWWKWK